MTKRSYSGPAFDATYHYLTEQPSLEESSESVEYATAAEPAGTLSTTGEPSPISSEHEHEQDSRLFDGGAGWQATSLRGGFGVQTSLAAFGDAGGDSDA